MSTKHDLMDLPRALRETLEGGWSEYETVIRTTRWGDGPLYILGSGASLYAAQAGVYAFEGLLGWPVIARTPAAFAAFSAALVKPGSVVIALSSSTESPDTLEAARAVKGRQAKLLVVAGRPENEIGQSELEKIADGVFPVRVAEHDPHGIEARLCGQLVIRLISLLGARVFRRPQPRFDSWEAELRQLPEHLEWMLSQMTEGVRYFTSQLKASRKMYFTGGGFFHTAALEGARLFRRVMTVPVEALDPLVVRDDPAELPATGSTLIVASGSRSRTKKDVHFVVKGLEKSRHRIFSVTDTNDRELSDRSGLTLFIPTLTDMAGSVLAHALFEWAAREYADERGRQADLSGREC